MIALAEVAHRLMILEAIWTHGLKPNLAVRKLKEFVQLVNKYLLTSLNSDERWD